jgi:hypothetical protein
METQIKRAIFCELKIGAMGARKENYVNQYYNQTNVTSAEDIALPDDWGAQVTLTLTADEKTSLAPGVVFKDPLNPAKSFGQAVSQSFSAGVGGTLSSQNVRYDKFDFFYTARDLLVRPDPNDICSSRPTIIGPDSHSTPFVTASGLGISEWMPGAIAVTIFRRSSRASITGEGAPLGDSGADSATYDNKFVIVTDANAVQTWNLLRLSTATASLIDLNRTRTHELRITIGPGSTKTTVNPVTHQKTVSIVGPSLSAASSHLASQIGSAVSEALQGQLLR